MPVRESDESGPLKDKPRNNAPLKNDPLKIEPSQCRSPNHQSPHEGPKEAAPADRTAQMTERPWRRKTRCGVFKGDVAAVELHSRLALGPERVPEPVLPASNAPAFAPVLRLAGGVSAAAAVAGVMGYLWGFGVSIKSPQRAPAPRQADVLSPPREAGSPAPGQADGLPAQLQAGPLAADSGAAVPPPMAGIEHPSPVFPAPPPPGRHKRVLAPQDRQRALDLLRRGEDSLTAGNIAAARLFYERAADAGLAEGALALAATFDAEELARRQVLGGVQPDRAAARRWYERARELGASEAENRLKRLGVVAP